MSFHRSDVPADFSDAVLVSAANGNGVINVGNSITINIYYIAVHISLVSNVFNTLLLFDSAKLTSLFHHLISEPIFYS